MWIIFHTASIQCQQGTISITRASLDCVTTLGWPRSARKSDIECCFFDSELKWPNDLEGQGQWPPFSVPAEIIPRCTFGSKLVIIAQIHYKLLIGQAKFPRILSQNSQNDLECHGKWPSFSVPAESIPRCMFDINLIIPAQICVSHRAENQIS